MKESKRNTENVVIKMKKTVKIIGFSLGGVLLLVVLALFLVSPIAKSYIQKHDKELIGREITIEKLRVNALFGKVKIQDMVVYEDDDVSPFLRLDKFETKIKLRDLLHSQLTVKRVLFSGLKLVIEQQRTLFNFSSIIDHFKSDEPKPEKEGSNFGVLLQNIEFEHGIIRYEDLEVGSEFLLSNLAIRIPTIDLTTLKTDVGLELQIGDSCVLNTKFSLSENAENYLVDLKINDFPLSSVEPYLKQSLAVDSLRGRANIDLQIQGNTEHIIDFDLKGGVAMRDLSIQDSEGYRLGFIDTVYAGIQKFNMHDNFLDLNRLYLSGLHSEYITHPNHSTNFDIVMGKHKSYSDTTLMEKLGDTIATEYAEVQERKPLKILVEDLCLDNIGLLYADSTLPAPFQYEVSDLKMTANNFKLDGMNTVRMQALLNRSGKLDVVWKGDLNGLDNHNLTLMLSNLKFTDFSPYSIQMFGFPLEKGTLSFHSQNVVTNGNLTGLNKVQIANPQVGDKWKDVEPQMGRIPLKLGFYLLTDKDDKLHLELPISGNLNDPEFSYWKAAMKVLGNLVVKVVTAPFRLLSSDDGSQYLHFDLLQPDFTAEEYHQIDNIAEIMNDKPELSITLNQKVNLNESKLRFSELMLQRDYYLSQHPEIDSSGIDFLTNEAIRAIRLTDKSLYEYASRYSDHGQVSSKKELEAVALAQYSEKADGLIRRLMNRRNELLLGYLTNAKGLDVSRVAVQTPDDESMADYKKECRYEIVVQSPELDDLSSVE